MKVDINLLPKKEKNYRKYIISSLYIVTTCLVIGLGLFLYWTNNQQIQAIEEKIDNQRHLNEVLSQEVSQSDHQYAKEIESLLHQLNQDTEVSELLERVMSTLPTDGRLEAMKLENGQLQLTMSSTSNLSAVNFYQKLGDSEWFNQVIIHTINFIESENKYVTSYTIHLQGTEQKEDE